MHIIQHMYIHTNCTYVHTNTHGPGPTMNPSAWHADTPAIAPVRSLSVVAPAM